MFGRRTPELHELRDRAGHAMQCVKCGNTQFVTDDFRATGGKLAKFINSQSKKFTTVSCGECGYTELYRGDTNTLGNVFDFFVGGSTLDSETSLPKPLPGVRFHGFTNHRDR